MATPEAQALLARWRTETDFTVRDEIVDQLFEEGIFPSDDQTNWETEGGLYPDVEDPLFLPKLLRKREYQELKQDSIASQKAKLGDVDKCRTVEDFELTSTQRFVARVLNPRTPYHGALLFHGVGVGKTCAAVTVAESYLEAFPGKKVFIIAPPNIQAGFKRTIFNTDPETLKMAKKDSGDRNHHIGCTGDIYLELTGTTRESNLEVLQRKVNKAVSDRYELFGYTSFYNYILNLIATIPKKMNPVKYEEMKRQLLREEFSNRVIIIDEAHNLRDNPLESESEEADDTPEDSTEAKAGKRLTPFLREVLEMAEGTTLVLMTATPMYNSPLEIVFLLNLLLTNDKLETLRAEDIFDVRRQVLKEDGKKILGKIASQYISFMRGENPLTFPIRLQPQGPGRVRQWPRQSPKGDRIEGTQRTAALNLPCYGCYFEKETESLYKQNADLILAGSVQSEEDTTVYGLGITNMEVFTQAGNFIFPGDEDTDFLDRIRQQGFENTFSRQKRGSLVYFKSVDEERGASWLLESELHKASGKCRELVRRLNRCRGVAFVYSRFVAAGALTIALALEANGYTAYGRDIGFLEEGNQHPDGLQCALCPMKQRGHGRQPEKEGIPAHEFKPAKYVLLTGSPEISPNNAKMIDAARGSSNVYGEDVKVVIGSQIAGEGLDLRYVREVFVFDTWYHLNKLEQIIGRGIRNRSHCALPPEQRNCTVTLLVNSYAQTPDVETVDMYTYRQAMTKAVGTGVVTRVLKEYAMDCTLNKDAIVVKDLGTVTLRDSQGVVREGQNINDTPLTSMCDWLETCEYECKRGDGEAMPMAFALEDQDASTYDEYTARLQMNKIRLHLQDRIIKGTPFVTFESIENEFQTIPRPLLASILAELVEQKDLKIRTAAGDGRIIYRNGYYLFQPDTFQDTSIPIAIRTAAVPVPRDVYKPMTVEKEAVVLQEEVAPMEEDSEQLWEEAKEWASSLRSGEAGLLVPQSLLNEVNKLQESAGIEKAQKEKLEMVVYIYETLKGKESVRGPFADVVLEYIWDEFLTTGTKLELLSTSWDDPFIQKVAKDSFWELEGKVYIRLVNSGTNEIVYLCIDGGTGIASPCPRAIVEVLQRETESDPLLQTPLDVRYTGYEYGFINFNPKKKKLVFKKGKPPMPNGKITRGSECSINSGTTYELKLLERFGKTLRDAGKDDMGLSEEALGRRRIQNSIRICTVSDLVLRYMDSQKVGGKRWFYKALEAKLYGHPLR